MYQKEAELVVWPPSATIVPMSPQPVIPSWVALQQSPRPLGRPQQASRTILLLYTAQQRNEICPCFPCLNRRVHSTYPPIWVIRGQVTYQPISATGTRDRGDSTPIFGPLRRAATRSGMWTKNGFSDK